MRSRSKISHRLQRLEAEPGAEVLTLTVKVTDPRGGEQLNLDFPAEAIQYLSKILPEAIRSLLEGAGLSISEIETKHKDSESLKPGPVLACAHPGTGQSILLFLH